MTKTFLLSLPLYWKCLEYQPQGPLPAASLASLPLFPLPALLSWSGKQDSPLSGSQDRPPGPKGKPFSPACSARRRTVGTSSFTLAGPPEHTRLTQALRELRGLAQGLKTLSSGNHCVTILLQLTEPQGLCSLSYSLPLPRPPLHTHMYTRGCAHTHTCTVYAHSLPSWPTSLSAGLTLSLPQVLPTSIPRLFPTAAK